MTYRNITTPAAFFTPEDLSDLKAHVELEDEDTDWDTLIISYAEAARSEAEKYIGQFIAARQIEVHLTGFNGFVVQPGPLQSIDKLEYLDCSGEWQIVDPSIYRVRVHRVAWPVMLAPGQSWPDASSEPENVRVTATAGMAADREELDPMILQALRLMIAHALDHKGDDERAFSGTIHKGAQSKLNPFRVWF